MKTQTKQNKIIAIMSAVILLLVALSATLTFAWFTAQGSATSAGMQFGHLSLTVDGSSSNLGVTRADASDHAKIVPGCTFTLNGNITVDNNIDAYLRFRVGVQITGAGFTDNASANTVARADLQSGITINDTALGSKAANTGASNTTTTYSVWHYIMIASDATSKTIDMSYISFALDPTVFGNDYQDATVTIVLEAEAIQAQHLGLEYTTGEEPDIVEHTIADGAVVGDANGANTVTAVTLESAAAWNLQADGLTARS